MVEDLSHHLALFDEEDGAGGFPNWTRHPIFSDRVSSYYTDRYDSDDSYDAEMSPR
jgi:hypothetical protein